MDDAITCPACAGRGSSPTPTAGDWYCDVCRGARVLRRVCPRCDGQGSHLDPRSEIPLLVTCTCCKGYRRLP